MRKTISLIALVMGVYALHANAKPQPVSYQRIPPGPLAFCKLDYKIDTFGAIVEVGPDGKGIITCEDGTGNSYSEPVYVHTVGVGLMGAWDCRVEGQVRSEGLGVTLNQFISATGQVRIANGPNRTIGCGAGVDPALNVNLSCSEARFAGPCGETISVQGLFINRRFRN